MIPEVSAVTIHELASDLLFDLELVDLRVEEQLRLLDALDAWLKTCRPEVVARWLARRQIGTAEPRAEEVAA